MKYSRIALSTLLCLSAVFSLYPHELLARATVERDDSRRKEERTATASACSFPFHMRAAHRINQLILTINNNGSFGNGFSVASGSDPFTNEAINSCVYPRGSGIEYLFAGAFWIGAVVGRDTLVSEGADGWSRTEGEFNPDCDDFTEGIDRKSIVDPTNSDEFDGAISEEDFLARYFDTLLAGVPADASGRAHRPLRIQVDENSYAWSYGYAEDFILFDYRIKNIGVSTLNDVYLGLYVDADVGGIGDPAAAQDDVCGFVETFAQEVRGCGYIDTVNLAWIADNDGNPGAGGGGFAAGNVTASRIVRTPSLNLDVSFNWWVSNSGVADDFGPRERPNKGRLKEDFRDFGTGGLGTPEGDKNKYYQLRNKEFDYDQVYSGVIGNNDTLWLPGNPTAACALDTRYLLSFGPFQISPGERLPISFAYVGGRDFHVLGNNINNCNNDDPQTYLSNLNFADLAENGRWASWIYDNPGVDTDGDGFAGDFIVCVLDSVLTDSGYVVTIADTIFTRGDGIPDFRGAAPPPAPQMWIIPTVGSLTVRFNGLRSETTRDNFSRIADFEGYRIWKSKDARPGSYELVASYDRENYNKWIFNVPRGIFELLDPPFTLDSLRCLYGASCSDTTFNPLDYGRSRPFRVGNDSSFYFEKQDFNIDLGDGAVPITKTYPNQPYPSSLDPDSVDADELTSDGFFKYFEYTARLTGLQPTVPYHIAVTAFDFGSPASGLPSLETAVTSNTMKAYANYNADSSQSKNLEVYVYPNPYREDSDYRGSGFEGRGEDEKSRDRVREVNFANLPAVCTIRIYSIDGDLIREIKHSKSSSDPTSGNDTWDLITRNTQLAVSGLYYWTVEAEDGTTQIGKLALIM